MRLPFLSRSLLTLVVSLTLVASVSAGSGGSSPNEVLSIEAGRGTFQIRGRGYLNMRVAEGTVLIQDLTPADRFSPYLGGVPRGKSSGVTGRDVNAYILGGRYKITVRGSGISISARGDGTVQVTGEPDETGSAGTMRIGDTVRPVPAGDSKTSFGGQSSGSTSGSSSSGSSSSGSSNGRDS
jgi:hypothetical protein